MSWKVSFTYYDVWAMSKVHTYDYGDKENLPKVIFDGNYEEADDWFKNEIFAMVDDCDQLLSWEVYEE